MIRPMLSAIRPETIIHRYESVEASTPVNAYVVESGDGLAVVDATLTVRGGRGLRALVDGLAPPLLGVVVTHAHPDHYGGLVELTRGLDVPVFSTRLVGEVIRRDDPLKEVILRPMFGDLWADERTFPTEEVADGETVALGDIALQVTDLGPSESPADSIWALQDGSRRVFSADLAYNRKHCYLADGFHDRWLANIEAQRAALAAGTTLHPGHGDPMGLEALDFQQRYIETFLTAASDAAGLDRPQARITVAARMRELLPTEELAFLMELSIDPLMDALAVPEPAR